MSISELELYKQFIEQMPVQIAMFDTQMRCLAHSKKWQEYYHKEGVRLMGNTHYENFPDIPPMWKDIHARALQGETIRKELDLFERDDGTVQYDQWEVKPWYISDTQIGGIIISTNDVTNLFELKEELHHKDQLLVQQSKMAMMGEMISAIGHQWKQPLSALSMYLFEIVYASEDGKNNQAYIAQMQQKMMEKIDYLSETIDDFKNFFRPDKQRKLIDLENTIKHSLKLLEHRIKKSNVTVQVASIDLKLMTIVNELEQVLVNIFSNALDALEEQKIIEPEILVTIKRLDDTVQIYIDDNAGGIPQDYVSRVFDSYFSTKDKDKGTGIGLYMSKLIVEESLRGRITVQNSDNGASFMIELPTE
jgi:PAS domain S-box-containing protein